MLLHEALCSFVDGDRRARLMRGQQRQRAQVRWQTWYKGADGRVVAKVTSEQAAYEVFHLVSDHIGHRHGDEIAAGCNAAVINLEEKRWVERWNAE